MKKKTFLDIVPRRRRPSKFDETETYYCPSTPRVFFKNIYGKTINGVRECFDHPDYQNYVKAPKRGHIFSKYSQNLDI